MTDYRTKFLEMFDQLQTTPLFIEMEKTVENSPWHREANVRVHTGMVVDEYVRRTDERADSQWTRVEYLGALACAFHDVGKPSARIAKYSEARGDYFAYPGHDLVSARLFEDYAMTVGMDHDDIWYVSWLIEHHMPWDIKDFTKRKWLALTANAISIPVYTTMLMADAIGRTSDDSEEKVRKSEEWVDEFIELGTTVTQTIVDDNAPVLIMPIAASGSGKSTLLDRWTAIDDIDVFSLDRLRLSFYDTDDYATAFARSCEDKTFMARSQDVFKQMISTKRNVFVDNTNGSTKRRRFWIDYARQHGYAVVAVLLPIQLQTILDRQHTRGDKNVPRDAVIRQYMSQQSPSLGEFDAILYA